MKKSKPITLWCKSLWKDRTLVLMTLPAVITLFLFHYVPISGLILAFKKFDFSKGMYGSPWCGLDNFRYIILNTKTFWRIIRNTVGYYLLFTAVGTVCNVALALAINELKFTKIGKYSHSVMIMPTFISFVAVSYIVVALLDVNNGLLNRIFVDLGFKNINFYVKAEYWPLILQLVNVWKGTGYGSILYLSTLAGVDQEMYEAAAIDGVNAWQRVFYISLPMLRSIVFINVLLGLGSIMTSNTGLFYQVTRNSGALYKTTQTIDAYVYNSIMKSTNYGATSAVTLFQSVVGCLAMLIGNGIVRWRSPEDALF